MNKITPLYLFLVLHTSIITPLSKQQEVKATRSYIKNVIMGIDPKAKKYSQEQWDTLAHYFTHRFGGYFSLRKAYDSGVLQKAYEEFNAQTVEPFNKEERFVHSLQQLHQQLQKLLRALQHEAEEQKAEQARTSGERALELLHNTSFARAKAARQERIEASRKRSVHELEQEIAEREKEHQESRQMYQKLLKEHEALVHDLRNELMITNKEKERIETDLHEKLHGPEVVPAEVERMRKEVDLLNALADSEEKKIDAALKDVQETQKRLEDLEKKTEDTAPYQAPELLALPALDTGLAAVNDYYKKVQILVETLYHDIATLNHDLIALRNTHFVADAEAVKRIREHNAAVVQHKNELYTILKTIWYTYHQYTTGERVLEAGVKEKSLTLVSVLDDIGRFINRLIALELTKPEEREAQQIFAQVWETLVRKTYDDLLYKATSGIRWTTGQYIKGIQEEISRL